MVSKLLFISEKKSMIANALIQGLENNRFRVTEVNAGITEISRLKEYPEIWVLYLQGFDSHMTDVLAYMRDMIDEHKIRLFAVGTPEEVQKALKVLPPPHIKGYFERPFRVDDVIDRLKAEVTSVKKLSESKRILVIDDDPTMLNAMKDLLSNHYRVYVANSGMTALQMLVNTEVDLILLDYEMPVLNGPKLLEMLRSETHTQRIPVMFLTSNNDRQAIIEVMALNPVNYLLKSLPADEIMKKIREFFEG